MSYSCWTTDGYGFCIDDLMKKNDHFVDRLLELMKKAPKFYSAFENYIGANKITEVDIEVLNEYGRDIDCCTGISSILRGIIEEIESITLIDCNDFDNHEYLLYGPSYPWSMAECERNLTEKAVNDMFGKYIELLSDSDVPIEYYSVENGG